MIITTMVLITAALLQSCTPNSTATRNKFPEFADSGSGFSNGFMSDPQNKNNDNYGGMTTSYVTLNYDGVEKQFSCIKLPSASDAQILALVSLFKPFAVTLIPQLPAQQKNGFVIDLRSTTVKETNCKRADYLIGNADNPVIPVVFLWDNSSTQRAAAYISQLGDVPGISIQLHSKN